MYTQCSKCETVFKLSAEALRAAGGQVRCGRCGEVFNALARLSEDASAFETGESALDLEARADSILESVVAEQAAAAVQDDAEDLTHPGIEVAHLRILDWNEEPPPEDPLTEELSESMEFTLPPGELDRIFIHSKPRKSASPGPEPIMVREFAPPQPAPTPEPAPPAPGPLSAPIGALSAAPNAASPRAPAVSVFAPVAVPHTAPPDSPSEGFVQEIDYAESGEPQRQPPSTESGLDVPDDVRFEVLSASRTGNLYDLQTHESTGGSFRLWLAAAILFALLLAAQMVHQNREWLAAHSPFGGLLRSLYSGMGDPASTANNLAAYQLRQWGVTGDPTADATLRVRASILNTASQLEPYPLLRVTLANRFGTRIGLRDFEPAEYMGKPVARMLTPGESIDATLQILDPGKNAEGFEIDVCLRGSDKKILCAGDTPPPVKR